MKKFLLVVLLLLIGLAVVWKFLAVSRKPPLKDASAAATPVLSRGPIPAGESSATTSPVALPSPVATRVATANVGVPPVRVAPVRTTPAPTPRIVYLPDRVDPPDPNLKSVAGRLRQYGPAARKRLAQRFRDAGVAYPPAKVLLVGLKQEGLLKVYAASSGRRARWRFVCQYPIVAAGASLGPKLREGDRQTPEGIYRVTLLNPESSYHLSMGINYPNEFDWQQAKRDKRTSPGGDIMIHGFYLSDGCLAMGDTAATDLFVLTADTGIHSTEVLLSPVDFRVAPAPKTSGLPAWTPKLYASIRARLAQLDDGISTQAKLIRYRDTQRPELDERLRKTESTALAPGTRKGT